MTQLTKLAAVLSGLVQNVDLTTYEVVVSSLRTGSTSGNLLTDTILGRLISLQNGTDVDATYHTHDGRYYTKTQLNSTTGGSSGAKDIGVSGTPTNYTAATPDVQAHLEGIDSALGTASNALDGTFRIENTSDTTKKIAFDASGIATGTTRTITMPDSNVDLGKVATAIQKDGSVTFTANQPMGSHKLTGLSAGSGAGDSVRYEQAILASGVNAFAADQSFGGFKATNLADPVGNQDAVTLSYMNARLAGVKPKMAVRAASTANVTIASALINGSTMDGVTLATGDRVLLKDQTAPAQNGIYIVAASGAASRSTDFDSVSPIDEINGAWTAIQEGGQAGQIWVQFGTVATVGTDAITFEYFNPIAGLIGGDMITFSGSTFSVDLATTSGLESTNPGNPAGQLRIKLEASNPSLKFSGSNELGAKLDAAGTITSGASGLKVGVDGSTIEINSNALRVKDAGITLAKLASDSVDENKIVSTTMSATGAITGGSGTKLSVATDGSTIEINSNALRVKDAGITLAKLASNSVDENKLVSTTLSSTGGLTGGSGTKVSVNVDGSTLEINTNTLRVKASGITANELATNSVTTVKITDANVTLAKLASDSVDENKIKSSSHDATMTGGSGTTLSVAYAPLAKKTMIAGEAYAANTSFMVRMAVNGETAGRVYKADQTSAAANGKFWAIGMVMSTGAVSAGQNIDVTLLGTHTLGSSDTPFGGTDIGKAVWLSSSTGGFSVTAPSSSGDAAYKIGTVETTTKVFVDGKQLTGVN